MVEVVDLRAQRAAGARERPPTPTRAHFRLIFSEPLEAALGERLQKGEQSILLLNRRGYAAFVQCDACGDGRELPELLDHAHLPPRARAAGLPLLPARGAAARPPVAQCGGATVRQRGLGTQQVERLLAERFP